MKKISPHDLLSQDVINHNIIQLKNIFPEVFAENKLDLTVLSQLLGSDIVDDQKGRFGLNWAGKAAARQCALEPSKGTLRPAPTDSMNWEQTEHLFIEGDNLEVLKLLQKSYSNSIKMIYIDPPYNTGNEFIYPDKFSDTLDTYLRYTDQKDESGFDKTSNKESSGRFHTNWLNMMYPRLKVARTLLKTDGVIFISIDDHEFANLKLLCDEIFGEENFYCTFVWQRRSGAMDSVDNTSIDHEYILCYGKNKDKLNGVTRSFEKYANPDGDPRGPWIADNLSAGKAGGDVYYPIEDPNTGNQFYPPSGRYWPYNRQTMKQKIAEGRVIFPKASTGRPMLKRFKNEAKFDTVPVSSLMRKQGTKGIGNAIYFDLNTQGTKEVQALLGGKLFSHPKARTIIKSLASQALTSKEDIVLDFFAGSSTTAHAVLEMNTEDNGRRRFIMVQLPEECDSNSEAYKKGYVNIAEISRERIKNVINEIKTNNSEIDLGFKTFKLDKSNFKEWDSKTKNIDQHVLDNEEHFVPGRTSQDVLYELLLKRGIDLVAPIEECSIAGKKVFCVGFGVLFVCLDKKIKREEIEVLAQGIADRRNELAPDAETQVVFRDSAFENDVAKVNMTAILDQNGIKHVRSL